MRGSADQNGVDNSDLRLCAARWFIQILLCRRCGRCRNARRTNTRLHNRPAQVTP